MKELCPGNLQFQEVVFWSFRMFLALRFRKAELIIIYSELNRTYIGLISTKDYIDDWIGFRFNSVTRWRNEIVFCLMCKSQRSTYNFYHFEEKILLIFILTFNFPSISIPLITLNKYLNWAPKNQCHTSTQSKPSQNTLTTVEVPLSPPRSSDDFRFQMIITKKPMDVTSYFLFKTIKINNLGPFDPLGTKEIIGQIICTQKNC